MIITRTPFRISFVGGGSDFKEYYQKEPGAVVSTTIDKYIFLSMHPLFNRSGYFLKYSDNELIEKAWQIKHPIIRELFTLHRIVGVDFNSSSDIPAGTGLGSSSAFTTGLVNLCYSYKHSFISREDIARQACWVEIEKLHAPIGKQDQYATAVGGLNFIQFNADDSVIVEKLSLSSEIQAKLEESLMLFYLGDSRPASSILVEQKNNIDQNFITLQKMVTLTKSLRDALKNNDIDDFGEILHTNWMYKKELASNITNPTIDQLYYSAIKNGAEGGKLLGAGGTGFLLLFVPHTNQDRVRKVLQLYELPFRFDNSGTTVVYA